MPIAASQNAGSAQITQFSGGAVTARLLAKPDQIGGYRVTTATSNRHAARLLFQSASEPSADYARVVGRLFAVA